MRKSSRIENSTRNLVFGTVKYIVMILFPFIIRTVLIYKLGTEYAGISSLFSSILQVLSLSELGFSTAVVYSLYEPVAEKNTVRICALLSFFRKVYRICGLFILFAGICVTPFVEQLISGSYPSDVNIHLLFVLFLLNTTISYLFCGYKSVVFSANQRDDILSKCTIAANTLVFIFQIISLFLFSSYYMYIISMIIGTLFNNYFIHRYTKKMYNDISCKGMLAVEEQKRLVKSVGSLFGHQLDMVIINSADNIVISVFLGLNILTIYNNYFYILNALLSILVMISNSFAGSIGNSIAIETKEKNYKNFIDFTYLIGMISSIAVILLFCLYQDFIKLWMGSDMLLDVDIVLLISISLYIRQFRRSLITYKIAAGIWAKDALKPYVACLANLIMNILMVKHIGLKGVVLSTILSFALIEIPWETIVFFKGYFNNGIRKYLVVQFANLTKMVVIGLFAYRISELVIVNAIFPFFLKAIGLGVFVTLLYIIVSYKDKEFSYILGRVNFIIKRG